MKRFVNIVINYANEQEVLEYAKSLSKQDLSNLITLVVVVNKEGDISAKGLEEKLLELKLDTIVYNPNKNLGYMNGLIYGFKQFSQSVTNLPQWVVMSNTDIKFINDKFFDHIINTKYDDNIWCIAPSVYSPGKNSYENPQYVKRHNIKDINRRIFIFERPVLARLYLKLADVKAKFFKKEKENSQYVYSAHGCFFILDIRFAQILKNKKYRALMYSEEAYIAELIRISNKKCYYDSNIEIIHNESTVTGKLNIRKKSKYIADSLRIVRDQFYKND